MTKVDFLAEDKARYATLKKAAHDGIMVCYVVGFALEEIKTRSLFVIDGYATWAEFCSKEFGYTKRYCDQLIVNRKTFETLPERYRDFVTSERAVIELGKLPESFRETILLEATAGGTKQATAESIIKSTPVTVPKRPVKVPGRPSLPKGPEPEKETDKIEKAAKKAANKVGQLDFTGIEIPRECRAMWNEVTLDAKQQHAYLRTVKNSLEKREDHIRYAELKKTFRSTLASIGQAISDVERAIPYAICYSCQGKLARDCETCSSRGFVSEFFWKTFAPDEIKALRKAAK